MISSRKIIHQEFETLVCCLKGIWVHPYTVTPARLAPDLWIQGHLRSGNDATTSQLRLLFTSDHFIHPYKTYTLFVHPFVPQSTQFVHRNSTPPTKYNPLSRITTCQPPSSNRARRHQQYHQTTFGWSSDCARPQQLLKYSARKHTTVSLYQQLFATNNQKTSSRATI